MYLNCHVTSNDHLIEGLFKLMGGNSLRCVTALISLYGWKPLTVNHHLAMFDGHWLSASGDIKYLICHVTSKPRD